MNPLLKDNLITTKEAAILSGYTTDYLARLARSEKINGQRVGNTWLIDKKSLSAFLQKQKNNKIEYTRSLARAREQEYVRHQESRNEVPFENNFSNQSNISKYKGVKRSSFQEQSLAFSLALLVLTFGAFTAKAVESPEFKSELATILRETSLGFNSTFGNIPNNIALQINTATNALNTTNTNLAARTSFSTTRASVQNILIDEATIVHSVESFLTHMNVSSGVAIDTKKNAAIPFHTFTRTSASSFNTDLDIQNIQSYFGDAYTSISAIPTRVLNKAAAAYVRTGLDAYNIIVTALDAYHSFIVRSSNGALVLAGTGSDVLGTGAHLVPDIHIPVAKTVVDATHAAIRADIALAYAFATGSPTIARTIVMSVGTTGNTLRNFTARVPELATTAFLETTQAPATLAPALAEAVFSAEYKAGLGFVGLSDKVSTGYLALVSNIGSIGYTGTTEAVALLEPSRTLFTQLPTTIENAYLGMIGKVALAVNSIGSQVPSLNNLPATLAAALPALSVGEQAALYTYQTIHNFFTSTTDSLASLFGNSNVVVVSNPPSTPNHIATSTKTVATPHYVSPSTNIVTNYPTYTTVVKGISADFFNQSLASLRGDILATVAGMIQPVAAQGVTNMTTIQQVNMIQDLSDLIVRNGDFRGGTFDSGSLTNGISVTAATGNFDNLTGGNTALGTTTITGPLTTTGNANFGGVLTAGSLSVSGISSGGAVAAPYFTATSSTATSTFAGAVGIGTTSPSKLLTISGADSRTTLTNATIPTIAVTNTDTTANNFSELAFRTTDTSGSDILASKIVGIYDSHTVNAVSSDIAFFTRNLGTLAEKIRITAAGLLGIGTTSPSAKLSVQGDGLFSGNISVANITATGTLSVSGISSSNAVSAPYFTATSSTATSTFAGSFAVGTSSPYGNGLFIVGTSSPLLYVDGARGYIGIGTTTPSARLEIYGSNSSTNVSTGGGIFQAITNADQTDGNFSSLSYRFINSAGSEVTGTRISGVFTSHTAGGESADLAFITRNNGTVAEALRIKGSGNVGIGTSSPQRLLTLSNSGATNQLLFEDTGASADQHFGSFGFSRGSFNINALTDALATTTLVTITNTGMVGIGTSAPSSQLQIAGNVTSAIGTTGSYFNIGNGSTFTDSSTASSGSASVYNAASISRSTLAATNSLVTTTQTSSLEISGGVIPGANETITTDYGIFIRGNPVDGGGGTATKTIALGVNALTGGTNNYAATFSGGNVGIGSLSPGAQLHIAGGASGTPSSTSGIQFRAASGTYTDTNTAASGSAGNWVINSFNTPTIAATNATVSYGTVSTLYIGGSPIAGTNAASITNSYALNIGSAAMVNTTNAYGLVVAAPTGATNNYAATFTGGNVGIGASATAPSSTLMINPGNISAAPSGVNSGIYLSLPGSNTVTDSSTAGSGTAANNYFNFFGNGVLAATNTLVTTTNAANIYIKNAVRAGTNQTITNSYALLIDNGTTLGFAGTVTNGYGLAVAAPTGATNNYAANFTGGNVGIGTATPAAKLTLTGAQTQASWTTTGSQFAVTASTQTDNTSTAGTTIATRAVNSFSQPTMAFTNATSTITNAATLYITGAPTANQSSALITTSSALLIAGGTVVGTTTSTYGLTVNAQSNASGVANYAAQFIGGNVGIGSAAPAALLQISRAMSITPGGANAAGSVLDINLNNIITDNNTAASGSSSDFLANRIGSVTLAATNYPVTTPNAYSLYVAGAPRASTNELITNAYALNIATVALNASTTSAYGLRVAAPSGATNNYAALFSGTTLFQSGNLGIGTTTPAYLLDIQGGTVSAGEVSTTTIMEGGGGVTTAAAGVFGSFRGSSTANQGFSIQSYQESNTITTTPAYRSLLLNLYGGNVGIGTTSPATALDVNGTITQLTVKSCSTGLTTNSLGSITGCVASDQSLKTNITPFSLSLSTLLQLAPVTYQWIDTFNKDAQVHSGFIAQQVETVLPQAVVSAGLGLKGVDPNAILALVVNAIKEQYNGYTLHNSGSAATSSISSWYLGTTTPAITIDASGNVGIGTTTPHNMLTVAGDVGAIGFVNTSTLASKTDIGYINASSTDDMLGQLLQLKVATYRYKIESQNDPLRLGLIAEDVQTTAPQILSIDQKGVDLYKLATFTLSGVQALAARQNEIAMRIDSLDSRITKLENGSISTGSGSPVSFSSSTLASALSGFGVLIQKGIAQFNTLAFHQLVATTDSSGASSAGTVTILAGNTVALINNSLVTPSTKIFATFNAQVTGSWWVSDKTTGSFRVMLSAPQTTDVSFDYFLVQTQGQIATSSPDGSNVGQSSGPDTVPPVVTLSGDNPLHVSVNGTFTEPGVQITDSVDGTDPYITFVNGLEQDISAAPLDTSSATTYIITYKATDQAGNSATAHRSVVVGNPDGNVDGGGDTGTSTPPSNSDTTPPVVTLHGAAAIQITVGDTFTDAGATASDNIDGNLTANIHETGTVDVTTPGLYNLTYSATDAAGNTGTVSRVVTVAPASSTTTP